MRLLTHLLLPVALLTGCAQTPSAPDLDLHMVWLGAENDAPPSDVATVTVQRLDAFGDEVPGASADYTLARLDDLDGDGRPELEQRQLPTNEAFTLRITARDSDGATNYRGQLGPITLAPGERRYAPVYLYKTSTASVVASLDHQFGLFPTATTLHDGRVLVAGGFDTTEESTCPPGMRETSICVVATGTNKAHLFDPASAQFYEVESGMLAARGGHTATPLPNGRVLIAGGAAAAYLVFEATNDEELPRRNFELYPLPSPDSEDFEAALTAAQQGNRTFGGHASFEIFDALRNAETEDVDRDGDPSRGAFVGSIDASDEPSPLNNARCLHTASPATGAEGESTARVVLAGGVHGDATSSWEVFDDRRPGGSGVYDNRGAILKAPRRAPSSEPIPGLPGYPILIAGGGGATDVNDLAEVCTLSG